MQSARMLGNYVHQLANSKEISIDRLSEVLGFTKQQVLSFFKGCTFASFSQITSLAKELGVSVDSLLAGDNESYNASVVHCMNKFSNPDNREFILDIIDDYIDVKDAVENQQ